MYVILIYSYMFRRLMLSIDVMYIMYICILCIYVFACASCWFYKMNSITVHCINKVIIQNCLARLRFESQTLCLYETSHATVSLPGRAGRGVWGEFDVTPASRGHASVLGGYIWRCGSQAPWR